MVTIGAGVEGAFEGGRGGEGENEEPRKGYGGGSGCQTFQEITNALRAGARVLKPLGRIVLQPFVRREISGRDQSEG